MRLLSRTQNDLVLSGHNNCNLLHYTSYGDRKPPALREWVHTCFASGRCFYVNRWLAAVKMQSKDFLQRIFAIKRLSVAIWNSLNGWRATAFRQSECYWLMLVGGLILI